MPPKKKIVKKGGNRIVSSTPIPSVKNVSPKKEEQYNLYAIKIDSSLTDNSPEELNDMINGEIYNKIIGSKIVIRDSYFSNRYFNMIIFTKLSLNNLINMIWKTFIDPDPNSRIKPQYVIHEAGLRRRVLSGITTILFELP